MPLDLGIDKILVENLLDNLSPDIDTVIYNLAGIEGEFGWGIKNDKFTVNNELKKYYDIDF